MLTLFATQWKPSLIHGREWMKFRIPWLKNINSNEAKAKKTSTGGD
jgi:hypothetical protein